MGDGKFNSDSSDRRLASLVTRIRELRGHAAPNRALLVGISGIDGSGKGFISAKLAGALRARSMNVALINADDWLNLPHICINQENPGEHFYNHALRLEEMFKRLIFPLRDKGDVDLVADCGDAKATLHRKHRYRFREIHIVILEGIFLFKPTHRDHFDLKIWIECSFETALERAIARGQEGLPPAETRRAFDTIYFPAQRIHLKRDRPNKLADLVFLNDPRSVDSSRAIRSERESRATKAGAVRPR